MLPKTLYKYQAITLETLENQKTRSIWFSSPSAFNDPFDCALQVISPDLSQMDTERALAWARLHVPAQYQAQIADQLQPSEEFRQAITISVQQFFEKQRAVELEKYGISCFSAKNDDLLMWGHYANGHRGICLEFDTNKEPFMNARPVTYSNTVPLFSPIDILDGNVDNIVEALILTKNSCWSYESEWRIPLNSSRVAIKYQDVALTGVYFGAKISNTHREIVQHLLRDESVKLYSMSIVSGSFALKSNII
jgi:hypothetical protein